MGRTLIEIQNEEQVRVNEKKEYNETRSASPSLYPQQSHNKSRCQLIN